MNIETAMPLNSPHRGDYEACSRYLLNWAPLKELPASEIRAAAHHWRMVSLEEGELLWARGSQGHELVLVLAGQLAVALAGDVTVASVGPWEIAGELSAFQRHSCRLASLRATVPTVILLLTGTGMYRVRREHPDFYSALVEHAVHIVAHRIRNTTVSSVGELWTQLEYPNALFAELRRQQQRAHRELRDMSIEKMAALLREMPALSQEGQETLEELARALTLDVAEAGEVLFENGDVGTACYLLARGELAIERQINGQTVTLARLGPGTPIGTIALLDGGRRTASCVAITTAWLLRMDYSVYRSLKGRVRVIWHELMFATLAAQLLNENNRLLNGKRQRADHR